MSIGLFLLGACSNDNPVREEVKTPEPEPEVVVVPTACNLITMEFKLGESSRSIEFSYENGVMKEGIMTMPETDSTQTLNYSYENGNLVEFSLNLGEQEMVGSYSYADSLLQKFKSGPEDVFLAYDSLGRIAQDSSRYKKRVYTCNSEGLPINAIIYNAAGEEIERVEVTYDDKINPFKGKSAFVNTLEVLIGYPMANQTRNITSIQTTYLKKSKYRINGVYKKKGEVAQTNFEYDYNELNYPTSISVSTESGEDIMELKYECE